MTVSSFSARAVLFAAVVAGLTLLSYQKLAAHCDTLDGPVVASARTAIEKSDVTPVLMWVRKEDEGEIRAAFAKTLVVRSKGPDARNLADTYFFETLVRVHRAGEGAPFTGLKPAGTDLGPAVTKADQSLENGSVDALVTLMTEAAAQGIRERFARASDLKRHAGHSVEAGREFVAAYVEFVHYVEALAPTDDHSPDALGHDKAAAGHEHVH